MPHPARIRFGKRPSVRYGELIRSESGLLFYAPLGDIYGLTDRSGYGRDATNVGGMTIGGAAGPGRLKATAMSGAGQRFSTLWRQGRNLSTNPKAATLATTNWANNGCATFDTTGALPTLSGLPAGVSTGFHCIGGDNADGVTHTIAGAQVGDIFTVSVYARVVAFAGASRIELQTGGGTGVFTVTGDGATNRLSSAGGNFVRLTLGFTCTTAGTLVFQLRQLTAGACEWHHTAVLVERTTNANAPLAYFDGNSGASSGADANWEGAANLSASRIGVFQNGKVRTLEGWASRAVNTATHALFSTDGGTSKCPALWIDSGAEQVRFAFDPTGATSVWADPTWPGLNQMVHFMLVADEPGDSSLLLLNGASKGVRANATPYSEAIGNFQIGAERQVSDYFNGAMCHVVAYDGDKSGVAANHYAKALAL